jgi:hypothetical protein
MNMEIISTGRPHNRQHAHSTTTATRQQQGPLQCYIMANPSDRAWTHYSHRPVQWHKPNGGFVRRRGFHEATHGTWTPWTSKLQPLRTNPSLRNSTAVIANFVHTKEQMRSKISSVSEILPALRSYPPQSLSEPHQVNVRNKLPLANNAK